ncbi:MAG: DUF456 domain-containing protein [Ignavibacteriaceae bacterium]|nr:DUF456 domain-containing protein [Ignavibacteriaceae bacterium]
MNEAVGIIGLILSIVGVIGCIIPGLPGPPLNLAAIIILKLFFGDKISTFMLILFIILAIAVTVLDYAIPLLGGKLFKASRAGIFGSTIGMVIGIFFFAPFGMFIGLVVGAIIGELISGKTKVQAAKAGAGIFVLSMAAIVLKLGVSLTMSFYFLYKLITISGSQFKFF